MARLIQRFWTWVIRASAWVFSKVPLKFTRPLGRSLGWLAYHLLAKRRAIAMANLEIAYGDELSVDERKRITRGAFANFGIVVMEFAQLPGLSKEDLLRLVQVQGLENIDSEKGALLISSHTANWEWMAPALAARDLQLAEVVNTYRDSRRGQIFDRLRRAAHVETIPKNLAASVIPKLLKEKTLVGILADQSARKSAVPVTMFGRACWSPAGPAILALREGVPVHVVNMSRESNGNYLLEISEPIHYDWRGQFRSDLCGFSQTLQDAIEAHVRRRPGQWLWMHDRWSARPRLEDKWADYRDAG